jgi:hypothetical protein
MSKRESSETGGRSLRSGKSLPSIQSKENTPAKKRVKINVKTPVKEIYEIPVVVKTPIQSAFQDAKSAFRRCATPAKLVGRVKERRVIQDFWSETVDAGSAGALYISGY